MDFKKIAKDIKTYILFLLVLNLLLLLSVSDRIGYENTERQKALDEIRKEAPYLATGLFGAIDMNDPSDCVTEDDLSDIKNSLDDIERATGKSPFGF